MHKKKWVWLAIRAGVSLLLLGMLFWQTDISQFLGIFQNADLPLFFMCLFSSILLCSLLSFRWQLLLKTIGITVPIKRLFKTYLIGVFFNNFLPTTIGGDMVRVYDLYRYTQKGKRC